MIDRADSQHEMDLDTVVDQSHPRQRNASDAWNEAKQVRADRELREAEEASSGVRNQHSLGSDDGEVDTAQNYHGAQESA